MSLTSASVAAEDRARIERKSASCEMNRQDKERVGTPKMATVGHEQATTARDIVGMVGRGGPSERMDVAAMETISCSRSIVTPIASTRADGTPSAVDARVSGSSLRLLLATWWS